MKFRVFFGKEFALSPRIGTSGWRQVTLVIGKP